MLSAEQMQELKKVNVSIDAQKTKTRISNDFKSAPNEIKVKIVDLSGLKRGTFYRVFSTGVITPRIVLAMAQTLDISPYYYTGASDEKGLCSSDVLVSFLSGHDYGELAEAVIASSVKPKRKYTRKAKEDVQSLSVVDGVSSNHTEEVDNNNEATSAAHDTLPENEEISILDLEAEKMQKAIENLDVDNAVILLKALYQRAEVSDYANKVFYIVKKCLLM